MAKLKKADAIEKKRREAILAEPPRPVRDWTEIVDARTSDPIKRKALLLEMARLDELESEQRPLMLQGLATAGRLLLDISKQRARLLGLTGGELTGEESEPDEVDIVDWTPSTPRPKRAEGDDD